MFRIFKKKKSKVTDKIWKSDSEKLEGILHDVGNIIANGKQVVLFYFFEETRNTIQTFFESVKPDISNFDKNQTDEKIIFVSALDIERSARSNEEVKKIIQRENLEILFAERYPVYNREADILKKTNDRNHPKTTEYLFLCFLRRANNGCF